MACPSILEHPAPSADATEFRGDRISYDISFSTSSIASAGDTMISYDARKLPRPRGL